MRDELPPCCNDPTTWRHRYKTIHLPDLLRLIEENGGPEEVDLHGCEAEGIDREGIDARPEMLRPYAELYARKEGPAAHPPWLSRDPEGGINLRGAHLRDAHLEHARLWFAHLEDAILAYAHLENVRIWGAHLENANIHFAHLRDANLRGAYLQNADLSFAHLQNADLGGAHLRGVVWYSARLDRTRMHRDQLGDAIGDELHAHKEEKVEAYHEASEAYLLLKNNFNSIGRYEDASWAYVKEQQMEKMAYYWQWRWRPWRAWGSFWRWLRNWAFELLTGYGERVYMPVLWALVVIAAFAAGYAVAGNIAPDFAGDPATAHGSHNFVDALTHSIGAFATIGFNTLEPLGWGARLLTAIESALGVSLFALFIFTLGNRMSRS